MRRVETYVGQQVYEWLFSSQAQHTMTSIAKVCAALLGTSVTVNGLPCTPTTPASMTVQIGPGEIYQLASLEATTCGTLPADTSHQILKQGIRLDTFTTGAFAAPVTSGQSINYLIEAQYQDSDISVDPTTGNSPVVLQFYNAANPSSPWSGPNNSGSTSNTFRDGTVAYQIKAGVAATTGSQVTPTPDAGWTGLWVVTVPFGASTLTSSNIAQYTGAPILPTGMLQSILTSNLTYGIDNGTANVVQATFPIPVPSLTDGMDIWVKIKNANTGATTFTPNPGVISAAPVVGGAHAALQGGELAANGRANLIWRQDISSWVLVECSGGAQQIASATQSQQAVQLGQLASGTNITNPPQFNNTTAVATAGWVNAVGLQYSPLHSGQSTVTTLVALDASYAGARVVFNNTANQSCTLPNPATWPNGGSLHLSKASSSQAGILTIGSFGATANIDIGSGLVSSITVQPGEDIFLVWSPLTSTWITAGTFFFRNNQFSSRQSLTGNGFQSLPGGLTLQWGSATLTTSTSTITLPKAANAAILAINITPSDSASTTGIALSYLTGSLTTFGARSNIAGGISALWQALTI